MPKNSCIRKEFSSYVNLFDKLSNFTSKEENFLVQKSHDTYLFHAKNDAIIHVISTREF